MKRNLKALGLAMVAALALSAVAASSAQALNAHHFQVGKAPAVITAHDETGAAKPAFSITGGEHVVECGTATYEGTVNKKIENTEVTVVPTYSGCEVDGLIPATIDVNHCAYLLTNKTNANGDAELHIECAKKEGTEEHTEITITYEIFGSKCVVHIHPTQTLVGVHYTQTENPESKKKDITIKATLSGIKYLETGSGFCPPTHTGEDGTLNGGITATAYEDLGSELVGTEKTTPSFTEGNVIDLELKENVT
jgi:hypothetical protein